MAYPKIKVGKTEIEINPSLIKLLNEQLPGQLKNMSFSEMMASVATERRCLPMQYSGGSRSI